jgi:FtsZ-binding cell division protein ZapB
MTEKNEEDSFAVLISIKDSIEELKTSSGYMKSSLKEIHSHLDKLDQNQNVLKSKFSKFSDQRIKAEQFFINTVTILRGDLNDLSDKVNNGSKRNTETTGCPVEEVGRHNQDS